MPAGNGDLSQEEIRWESWIERIHPGEHVEYTTPGGQFKYAEFLDFADEDADRSNIRFEDGTTETVPTWQLDRRQGRVLSLNAAAFPDEIDDLEAEWVPEPFIKVQILRVSWLEPGGSQVDSLDGFLGKFNLTEDLFWEAFEQASEAALEQHDQRTEAR